MTPILSRGFASEIHRRTFLQASATAAAVLALAGAGGPAFTAEALPPLASPGRLSQDEFMRLSAFLTNHGGDLKPEIGAGLFQAYAPGSAANKTLAELYEKIRTSGIGSVDALAADAGLHGSPLFAAAVSVIAAWYLGMTGTGPETRLVTYEDALMFKPVADVLTVPTFCFGETGAWAAPPPGIGRTGTPETQAQPPADQPSEMRR